MTDLPDDLQRLAGFLGRKARRLRDAVEEVVIASGAARVVGYRGYGSPSRLLVLGRVLQRAPLAATDARAGAWRNLLDTVRRVQAGAVPHAAVRLTVAGVTRELLADDEGYVRQWIDLPAPVRGGAWVEADLTLVDPGAAGAAGASRVGAPVLVPSPAARFGVISDLDDTVIQSQVTSFLRAAQLLALGNARTRLPFPGVAAFYRALAAGGNPIFYVSSGPWNLYDVIAEFLEAQGIPAGPMLLRDWDLDASILENRDHKRALIAELLATYPALPFILVGDSGQEDPEIYAEVVREHPSRILAIYIRNVSAHPERSAAIRVLAAAVEAAGSALVLADDTLATARHAAEHGWIDLASLGAIGAEKGADEGVTGDKRPAPGTEEPPEGATRVVDPEQGRREV